MDPKQPLRPQYFLARANGELTALVAVDELPHNIAIHGVPRVFGHGDTAGMTSLGAVPSRGRMYSVQVVSEGTNNESQPQTTRKTGNSALSPNPGKTPLNPGSNESSKNVKGKAQEPPKKEYCSYWIRNGECDYQQQGCKFKHEMPLDPTVLTKLCLRDIPKWYREKHGVSSMRGVIHASQMFGDRKPGNPPNQKNTSTGEPSGSHQIQHVGKWRQFAQPESGSAPVTMRRDSPRGSPVATAGPSDLLTQDLLPNYPALHPVRPDGEILPATSVSAAQDAGSDPPSTKLPGHPTDPQSGSHGKTKNSNPNTRIKSQERFLPQRVNGSENAAPPMQRHTRRQRSRKIFQPQISPGFLESDGSLNPNANATNQNETSTPKTATGSIPRPNILPSRVPETFPQPSTSRHKRSQSTLAKVQTTAEGNKQEKSGQAKDGNRNRAEKNREPETAKSTVATSGETKAAGVNLKPGIETDVFGLGIYDN